MWVDTNKELLISIKITEGLRSNGGGSAPSASLHQPRKVGSGIRKSQLCRRPRLFFHTQASYFGGVLRGTAPHRAEWCMTRDYWCAVWFTRASSFRELQGEFTVHVIPKDVPMSQTAPPTPTSWWQNILKQRDSSGLHDALNHIFRIWTWVTLTTRRSKHSGISFRDITANADLQKQQPLTYDTVEE